MGQKGSEAGPKNGSLSSNLLNMKFMKRSEPVVKEEEAPISTTAASSASGWSIPKAQKLIPKKIYQSPSSIGFADLEEPTFGRMVWKNGRCKQVFEDQEEKPVEVPDPEPAKRKPGKNSTKKPKKKAKRGS